MHLLLFWMKGKTDDGFKQCSSRRAKQSVEERNTYALSNRFQP